MKKFDKELYELFIKNYNQSIDIGEPYIFLKDYKTYKKKQIVYPFTSSPTEKRMVEPVFKEAIDLKILVKQNDLTKINSNSALISENKMSEGLATKIFGHSTMFGRDRTLPFMIVGAIVGGYYAKSKSYSTILGAIVGGAIPLVLQKLLENYDRSKLPYQEPKSKVPIMKIKQPTLKIDSPLLNKITKEECEKQGKQYVEIMCIKAPCSGSCIDK